MIVDEKIIELVHAISVRKGRSYVQIAEQIGVSNSAVSYWGRRMSNLDRVGPQMAEKINRLGLQSYFDTMSGCDIGESEQESIPPAGQAENDRTFQNQGRTTLRNIAADLWNIAAQLEHVATIPGFDITSTEIEEVRRFRRIFSALEYQNGDADGGL